jgi:hypothetical protein
MSQNEGVTMPPVPVVPLALPRYKCFKEVEALRIRSIEIVRLTDDQDAPDESRGAIIIPEEPGYPPFRVSAEFLRKHRPQVGGYWIKYSNDGYQSFSPKRAFEEGYKRI